MPLRPRSRTVALAVGAALTIAACGGGTADIAAPQAASGQDRAEQPQSANQLPVVDVIDLATGNEVNLASFAPADTPIVLWFWAPY